MPARNKIKAGSGYDRQDTGDMKEGRDLSLIMIFSQVRKELSNEFQRGNTSRIIHCKISREDLEVSDAFGLLSSTEKGSKKTDSQNLSRLEWVRLMFYKIKSAYADDFSLSPAHQVSKQIDIETFPNTSFTLLQSRSTDNHLNRITLLSNTLPGKSNGKMVYLDLNPLRTSQVGSAIRLDHEILDVSLNAGLLVGPSNTNSLALVPDALGEAQPAGEVAIDIGEAFALAIINNASYEDLLRQYQPIFKKLKGPALDEALQFVWKILQEHEASRERKKGGDWLVPFLQLQAAVFRYVWID
ncbi:hypothetical protein QFC22_002699 [Naganishia vaughanmartiniae]|uniref:Uncharacterized protein n=1 Tax=Naganishia vaughanmartiniae TaxID=1424756 RepID=A0ACC2XDF0_9TREE|nr:hypothetical protein QFC22_002699 [Naganishia vaughanmartiniae]